MQIYWVKNGKKQGPASVPDVEAMLQLGELEPETLGWHAGCEKWLPLSELPALADFFAPREESEAARPIAVELGEKLPPGLPPLLFDVILPGPMVRFLARVVDMALYATLLLGVLNTLHAPYSENLLPSRTIFWLPLLVIEACIIYWCGVTPGKWLLGIRVQFTKGRRSFPAALMRSIIAFIMGLGCMYLPVCIIMLIISYISVRMRGIAIWDFHTAIVPMTAASPSPFRKLSACIIIYMCMQTSSIFMQPWLPDIINAVREHNPAAARSLEDWINMQRP